MLFHMHIFLFQVKSAWFWFSKLPATLHELQEAFFFLLFPLQIPVENNHAWDPLKLHYQKYYARLLIHHEDNNDDDNDGDIDKNIGFPSQMSTIINQMFFR